MTWRDFVLDLLFYGKNIHSIRLDEDVWIVIYERNNYRSLSEKFVTHVYCLES